MESKSDFRTLLQQLNLSIRQDTEQAEAYFNNLNLQLRQLHAAGLFPNVALLGPVVLVRPNGIDGPWDTGEVIQAALGLPAGLGAIYWDTDEVDSLQDHPNYAARIVAYEECELAVRALLKPCAGKLLRDLMAMVKIYPEGKNAIEEENRESQ